MNTLFLTTILLITRNALSWANEEVVMDVDSSGNQFVVESHSQHEDQKFEVIKMNETTAFRDSEWADMDLAGENFYMLDLKKGTPVVSWKGLSNFRCFMRILGVFPAPMKQGIISTRVAPTGPTSQSNSV